MAHALGWGNTMSTVHSKSNKSKGALRCYFHHIFGARKGRFPERGALRAIRAGFIRCVPRLLNSFGGGDRGRRLTQQAEGAGIILNRISPRHLRYR